MSRYLVKTFLHLFYWCCLFYALMRYAAGIDPKTSAMVCGSAAGVDILLMLIAHVIVELGWL